MLNLKGEEIIWIFDFIISDKIKSYKSVVIHGDPAYAWSGVSPINLWDIIMNSVQAL